MRELFQSAFLQALGKAIADSIWQMGLLFLLYHLLVFLFRIKQATVKNFISTVFALSGFAWFISGIAQRWQQQLLHKTSLVISEGNLNNTLLSNFTNDNRWELFFNWLDYKIQFVLPYLSIAYLFVLLWFGVKLVVQLQAANALRYKGLSNVSDDMQEFFAYLVETMGLQRPVQLFISKQIDIPATLGFLKPIVLLPATAVTHLTAAQLEAVLLHELAHIKRNDYFWNLLLSVSETMLFFNPFALLLIGIARRERENSCDDHVMNFQQNAAVYAEALLNVEKARIQNPQLVMALGDNKHHLMDRVKRILNIPAEKNKISTRLLALLLFTVVFALMGWLIKERQPIVKTKQPVAAEQLTNEKTKTVYFTTDAMVKQKNDAVLLRDDKQKIRLELKEKINDEDIIVWNETEEKELKFDKVIFNDMPAEWFEQLVKPGVRVRLPDVKHKPGVAVRLLHDSTFISERDQEMEMYIENVDRFQQGREQRFPQQRMRNAGGTTMHYSKNWNVDSLMHKFNGQFNFRFEGNDHWPEGVFREYFPAEEFYMQPKIIAQQQAADDVKKERLKARFNIVTRKPKKDTTDNAQVKTRMKNGPVLAYLYDQRGLREDVQAAQQHVQIILEDNHLRLMNQQPPCTCPDSLQIQRQAPAQPKRVIKKLEVIRL
jgi:beta-lactamase regulating signal transducer with metallopeptidase domain